GPSWPTTPSTWSSNRGSSTRCWPSAALASPPCCTASTGSTGPPAVRSSSAAPRATSRTRASASASSPGWSPRPSCWWRCSLVREISARFGFDLAPDALVENLPVGAQQRVEIIKALSRSAEVLVLDEPTAVLTPQETDELMEIMRQLRDEGTSIVFITHKLREVKAVSDRITVIRRGKVVGEADPSADQAELAYRWVGRQVSRNQDKGEAAPGEVALEVTDLRVIDAAGTRTLDGVSFEVRHGEVLATAGVQGNGQTELAEALLGLQETVQGSA